MLRFAHVAIGEPGSSRCRRCRSASVESLRSAPEILADVTGACAAWAGQPGPNVEFVGAEPFHHPQLLDLVRAAIDAGAQRVRLQSDCVALDSRHTAEAVLAAGVRQLEFEVRGADEASHVTRAGAGTSLEATLEGASRFRDVAAEHGLRVHVSARVPVCKHNVHELPAIVAVIAERGITSVRLVIEDESLDPWGEAPWIEAACDTGIVDTTWVEVEGVPYGAAPGWELHLASVYRHVDGDKSPVCAGCVLDGVCGGVASGSAERITGRLHPPGNAAALATAVYRGFDAPAGAVR